MTAPREPHRPPAPPDRLPSPRGGHPSSQTESAAARPAGFARLAGARRGLVHSVRTLAAAALLALSGGLALPATAEAQTCTLNTGDLWCGVVTVGALELIGVDRCIRIHGFRQYRCPVRHRVQCRNEQLHD